MSDPQPHSKPPTPKQLRYLRDLAVSRGQSFAYPQTSAEASREIERLKKAKRTPAADRRRERRAVQRDMAEGRGDAAAVRADDVGGYGSGATWK
ncbi:MAG TPA: hypothetical protein VG898_02450 [Solirubrobacterales bacterium]|nr:hypothetical protein [Solirubrobacterales bacterium]